MKSKDQLVAKLNRALHAVRTDLDTCIEQYRLRVNARLAELTKILEGHESAEHPTPMPGPAMLKTMVRRVESLATKPRKGRGKDLKRIDDLVAALLEQLQQDK